MIYLIRSFGRKGKSILKIGFTDNLNNRLGQYFYHNPECEVISIREGDEFLETLLLYYFKVLGYQYKKNGKLNEWFIDTPEVYQLFHIHQRTLEQRLWKFRDKIFDLSKLSNFNYTLFEYLYLKNKETFVGEKLSYRDGKVFKTKAKEVDCLFWKIYLKRTPKITRIDISNYSEEDKILVQDFLDNYFYKTGIFKEKMRLYCEFMDRYSGNQEIEDIIYFKIKDSRFRKYYNFYGTPGCRAVSYEELKLYDGMSDATKENELSVAIYGKFKVGQAYTLKEIKGELGRIYRDLGITSISPKATDLGKYFTRVRTRFTDPQTKKRIEGYKLEAL